MEKDKVLEVIRLEVDRDVPALIGSGIGTLSLDWAAHRRQHFERVSRAILTALEREGWAVVPVVPTEAMIEAAIHADMPVEEGDVLLEATLLDVSWTKVAENAGHPAGAVGSASDRVAERMLRDPSFT